MSKGTQPDLVKAFKLLLHEDNRLQLAAEHTEKALEGRTQPAPCHMCGGAKVIPADDGEGLQTCKCCKGTGIKPNFTGVNPKPAPLPGEAQLQLAIEQTENELAAVERERAANVAAGVFLFTANIFHVRRILDSLVDLQAQLTAKDADIAFLREQREANAITLHTRVKSLRDCRRSLASKERECEEMRRKSFLDRETVLVLAARAESAEAFKQRVMEWARGSCGICAHAPCHQTSQECKNCTRFRGGIPGEKADNWTPPKAWEV